MILVDTSIWIDHLHQAESDLVKALDRAEVAAHPMIIGELALGGLKDRRAVLDSLAGLPSLTVATNDEVLRLVEERQLFGRGLSLVDAHLLASVILTPDARLWTRDKQLLRASEEMDLAFSPW